MTDDIVIRDARVEDADDLAPLLATLGYPAEPALVRDRYRQLLESDPTARVLVGIRHGRVAGVATLHVTPMLHRPTSVGRITVLVVAPDVQGTGVGRRLVEAAEWHFEALGLERVEVTSGVTHRPAYDFYRRLGYQDHGVRFAKPLPRESP